MRYLVDSCGQRIYQNPCMCKTYRLCNLRDCCVYLWAWHHVQVIRCLMLLLAMPIINIRSKTLSFSELTVLAWSGLRGAVGLALSLSVYNDRHLHSVDFRVTQFFHVGAIVLLTVTIQGSTMRLLLKVSLILWESCWAIACVPVNFWRSKAKLHGDLVNLVLIRLQMLPFQKPDRLGVYRKLIVKVRKAIRRGQRILM